MVMRFDIGGFAIEIKGEGSVRQLTWKPNFNPIYVTVEELALLGEKLSQFAKPRVYDALPDEWLPEKHVCPHGDPCAIHG